MCRYIHLLNAVVWKFLGQCTIIVVLSKIRIHFYAQNVIDYNFSQFTVLVNNNIKSFKNTQTSLYTECYWISFPSIHCVCQ